MADQINVERLAIVAAHNALEVLLEWDKSRNFIVPYKVRDPIHEAMKQLRAVLGNTGVTPPSKVFTDEEVDTFYDEWEFAEEDPGRIEFCNLVREIEHRLLARLTPGVALPREPSEEQITAALSAAAFFDTPQSRKDMRKALLAAAGIVPPGQEWMWPNGVPGVPGSDGQTFSPTDASDSAAASQQQDGSESAVSAPSDRELLQQALAFAEDVRECDRRNTLIAAIRAHLGEKT